MLDGGGVVDYNTINSIAQILMSLHDKEAAAKWAEEDALANSAQDEGVGRLHLARQLNAMASLRVRNCMNVLDDVSSRTDTRCHSICFIFLVLIIRI